MIHLAKSKQTIIPTKSTVVQALKSTDEVIDFLRSNSKKLEDVMDVHFLAQGGEATIYRVDHTSPDEIVAKCPVVDAELTDF
jgi:hypothetical protein